MKKKKGILVLMGRPGCGKTYICSALISWMHDKVGDLYFHREDKFFEKIRASMELRGDYHQEIEYQCDHDFLVIDDVGSIGSGKTEWRQEVYYSLVNLRYESKKPTVFSTNYSQKECYEKLGPRTTSRLFAKENTIIDMFEYPDLRMQD